MRWLLALLVALTPVHAFMSGPAPRRTSATRRPLTRECSFALLVWKRNRPRRWTRDETDAVDP